MEPQIHWVEQEAYSSVLRAFKAQSDAGTWATEGLMTELRKELRISDDEHRELLGRVNEDELLRRIREWRQGAANPEGLISSAVAVGHPSPSPTVSASRKKQKTSQSTALVPPPIKAHQIPPVPGVFRGQIGNPTPPGPSGLNEPQEAATVDPLVGRKVRLRWAGDNNFYEAVIADYQPELGRHGLVYDISTNRETWEWVNLKEISPGDIIWDWEGRRGNMVTARRGIKKSGGRGGLVSTSGRGRVVTKGQPKKDFEPSQNGIGNKVAGDIEILHTETLLKEGERVTGGPHPHPASMEKAKKVMKEHEESLVEAIARLGEASDGESGVYFHLFISN